MNIVAFPFYDALTKQVRFSERAILAPQNRWLPFMLVFDEVISGIDCVNIFHADTNDLYKTVSSLLFNYELYEINNQTYLFYYGGFVSGLNMPCGNYFLEIKGFYSEVFNVVNTISRFIKIEWGHVHELEGVIYQTGFRNELYLDTIIAEPTYKVDEEGREDVDGNFYASRSRVEKTRKLDTYLLPEFLVDALVAMAVHSEKTIGRFTELRGLKVTPDWNREGDAANVEITFIAGKSVTAYACENKIVLKEIDVTAYTPQPCDGTAPDWQDTGATRCEKKGADNTGYLEKEQKDMNLKSLTYGLIRWLKSLFDADACPLPKIFFDSAEIKELVSRSDCPAGSTSTKVEYILPRGAVRDTTNQVDVDRRARILYDETKEAYAQQQATCEVNQRTLAITDFFYDGSSGIVVEITRSDTDGEVTVYFDIFHDDLEQPVAGSLTIQDGIAVSRSTTNAGRPVGTINRIAITSIVPPDIYSF